MKITKPAAIAAVSLGLFAVGTSAAHATEFDPYPASGVYNLPSGWNDPDVAPTTDGAIWPQTIGEGCGWNQRDQYLIESAEEEAAFSTIPQDGFLTQGEDSAFYVSHEFYFVTCDVGEPEGPGETAQPEDTYAPVGPGEDETATPSPLPADSNRQGGEGLAVTGADDLALAWAIGVPTGLLIVFGIVASIVAPLRARRQGDDVGDAAAVRRSPRL